MGTGNSANLFAGLGNLATGIGSLSVGLLQSNAIKAQGEFQKKQSEFNSKIAELQARDAIRRGEKEVKKKRQSIKQIIGAQRAAFAAQGVEIDSGSALFVQQSTRHVGEMDIITIRNNAFKEAWGYKIDAIKQTAAGAFSTAAAQFKSGQSILTGTAGFTSFTLQGLQSFRTGVRSTKTSPNLGGTSFKERADFFLDRGGR